MRKLSQLRYLDLQPHVGGTGLGLHCLGLPAHLTAMPREGKGKTFQVRTARVLLALSLFSLISTYLGLGQPGARQLPPLHLL